MDSLMYECLDGWIEFLLFNVLFGNDFCDVI